MTLGEKLKAKGNKFTNIGKIKIKNDIFKEVK